jgi:hypothetical protein
VAAGGKLAAKIAFTLSRGRHVPALAPPIPHSFGRILSLFLRHPSLRLPRLCVDVPAGPRRAGGGPHPTPTRVPGPYPCAAGPTAPAHAPAQATVVWHMLGIRCGPREPRERVVARAARPRVPGRRGARRPVGRHGRLPALCCTPQGPRTSQECVVLLRRGMRGRAIKLSVLDRRDGRPQDTWPTRCSSRPDSRPVPIHRFPHSAMIRQRRRHEFCALRMWS